MKQRRRPGGIGGLGYYTSYDNLKTNGCIYCGKPATTREHVPSKAFLLKPFPENLPVIPACFECNNNFSEDENYVSCFLDILKKNIYSDNSRQNQTQCRLEADEKLLNILEKQVRVENGKVYYQLDEQKIFRILLKLARGHAGFEVDYVSFDNSEVMVYYDFIFNMSNDVIEDFESIMLSDIASEIGTRSMTILQNVDTGDATACSCWNYVQDNQYRYQVFQNELGVVTVILIIFEFLYCKIVFPSV